VVNKKTLEQTAPWFLLVITLVIWQAVCSIFNV